MDIAIWVVQSLLALAFGMAGFMKFTQDPEQLIAKGMAYVEDLSLPVLRGIGALEFLGALGLVLPMLTQIFPILTPVAASGLVLTMLGAASLHFRRKEFSAIGINAVLLLLAAFVAYGRFVLVPVA
jgi:uncharacterized membrane protein YphA (DoxX/SURF4 family)